MLNPPADPPEMSRHRVVEMHSLGNGIPLRIAVDPGLPFPASVRAAERESLMTGTKENREARLAAEEVVARNAGCSTFCIGATMCLLVVIVVTISTVMYVRVEYLLEQGTQKVLPFLDAGLDDVSTVLDNSAAISTNLAKITTHGDTLLSSSVPSMLAMLNTTKQMMARLEHFSAHQPSIQIGVG